MVEATTKAMSAASLPIQAKPGEKWRCPECAAMLMMSGGTKMRNPHAALKPMPRQMLSRVSIAIESITQRLQRKFQFFMAGSVPGCRCAGQVARRDPDFGRAALLRRPNIGPSGRSALPVLNLATGKIARFPHGGA